MSKPLGITEVVLRDAHQSLLATRLRIEDMLPICGKLDKVGYWSLECWGGATFDACIRYLGEDPWDRLRQLKKALPNTPLQMLLRGQNLLGYRHYADDVVDRFVERAAETGIDIFRIFDALNDTRNFERAVKATLASGKHAQGAISYTVSPVHTQTMWIDLARKLEDMGCQSVCIKDMAGLLKPYAAAELVSGLKSAVSVPIHLHCHATTGLSTATLMKAVEAGADNVDTAISSMSMTYGHSATEALAAIYEGHERDSGLRITLLEEIAAYFREVRKKYARFEGSLRGIDSRILVAQVPGGMLTNMESQLKEQGALDRFDEVMLEIPRVREDLGLLPLVTPTSQIVGTQAVINVLSGERYKTITKETAGVLRGEYGITPAQVNASLQTRVLQGTDPITCRPADLIEAEMPRLTDELRKLASDSGVKLGAHEVDDVLIYALFAQQGWRFLQNRRNPAAFEPRPEDEVEVKSDSPSSSRKEHGPKSYVVHVNGKGYQVEVAEGGEIGAIRNLGASQPLPHAAPVVANPGQVNEVIKAPMGGHILRVLVREGQEVTAGQVVVVMEAMKMETEVRARNAGIVESIAVKPSDTVTMNDVLLTTI